MGLCLQLTGASPGFFEDGFYFAIPQSLPITFGRNPIVPILRNKETSQTEIIKIKRKQGNKLKTVCLKIEKPE